MEELLKDLKMQTEACYMTIKEASEKLEKIRSRCLHPKDHIRYGSYESRVGHIIPDSKICGVCGELLDVTPPY